MWREERGESRQARGRAGMERRGRRSREERSV
jgi:hypothetical protein